MRGFSVVTLQEEHDWVVQQNEQFRAEFGVELYAEPVEEEPVSYLDHFDYSVAERREILGIVQDILSADSKEKRDEIVAYCAETSYPQLFEMLKIACKAIVENGDLAEAISFGASLKQNYPQHFEALREVFCA